MVAIDVSDGARIVQHIRGQALGGKTGSHDASEATPSPQVDNGSRQRSDLGLPGASTDQNAAPAASVCGLPQSSLFG